MNGTWDLSVFYNGFDDPRIEGDFARIDALIPQMKELLAGGGDAVTVLTQYADLDEELETLFDKLSSFASLTLATEASNASAMQLMDRVMQLSVSAELLGSAFSRYLGAMSAEALETAIASSDKLQAIAFYLRRSRDAARHNPAPEIEEWLLRMSLDGASAFSTLRDQLDATVTVDYRGEQLPLSAVRGKAEDPDPQVRRDAYLAELASYKKIEIPMAACLNGIKGQGLTMIEAKHFDSILAESLYDSNMDQQTLDAM